MKAALVTGNRRVSIVEVPEPQIVRDTQIKIKVILGAICNTTDNKVYATDTPEKDWPNRPFPFIIGHECTGYVIEKGEAVKDLEIGDKIVYWTVNGQAFADEVILDTAESVVGKIRADVDDNLCAIMEMVIGSTRLLFKPDGEPLIQKGDRVALLGLGPAGLIYAKVALLMGAERVVAYGRRKIRLDAASSLGACAAIDAARPDAIDETLRALGGPADVVIDATGGDVVAQIIALSRPGTRAITYGIPPFQWKDRLKELVDHGIEHYTDTRESALHSLRHCIAWAESGMLDLAPIITHRLPIEQIGRGLDMCREERDTTLKVIVEINPDYKP
jgi:threonine dehydrogenase-like Zn-dependent dehydrogenase